MARVSSGVAVAAALCAVLGPSRASACGGFFCSSAPVNQASETIVYGIEDDGTLVMAVQLRYAGFDDDFAWILPVPAPPELRIGTEMLFSQLEAATQPTFTLTSTTTGTCRPHPTCYRESGGTVDPYGSYGYGSYGGGGCGASAERAYSFADTGPRAIVPIPPRDDAGASLDSGARRDAGVEVVSMQAVGAYESVVLGAATAVEVVDWLQAHGYDVPSSSAEPLDAYAAAGHYFVALRLAPQRTTNVLRPIVLRMATSEACLPIRLTRIATIPDMPITAIFLGRERMTPLNYSLAEPVLGSADVGLWIGGLTWTTRVIEEVRRLGGHAFVADFAGPTPAVVIPALAASVDLATETDPAAFLAVLAGAGYNTDPGMQPLLARSLVPPGGQTLVAYVNCLARGSVASCGAPDAFDPVALAAAIEAEISVPRREAQALIRRHPYATRLFTAMSAADMSVDPVFRPEPGLDDVTRDHPAAEITRCSDDYYREDAPRDLVIGTDTISETVTPSSDTAYCHALGGFTLAERPASTAYTPAPAAPRTATSRGCHCSSVLAGGAWSGWILLGAALAVVWHRGRRRD